MSERDQVALGFLRQQVKDLEAIQSQAMNAVNAVLAKEQFQKWKRHVLTLLAEKVGSGYAKRLWKEWFETAFPGGDMYEELADDIDMCLRQLKKLTKEIETQGLQEEIPPDT